MDGGAGIVPIPSGLISGTSPPDLMRTPNPGVETNPHDHIDAGDLNEPIEETGMYFLDVYLRLT